MDMDKHRYLRSLKQQSIADLLAREGEGTTPSDLKRHALCLQDKDVKQARQKKKQDNYKTGKGKRQEQKIRQKTKARADTKRTQENHKTRQQYTR